ncbi:MAG: hypothetical protein GF313_12440 [Caldithrix sp.]|nr:hypothetical protein [Caldithrix sp.]
MIDLHSHYLSGVDDGASNSEQSLAMIAQASELGITGLLATPHATDLVDETMGNQFLERFEQTQNLVQRKNIDIRLYLGSELFFSPRIYDWLRKPWATFNNNRKYFLFELPLLDLPEKVDHFIFQCRLEGLMPIMAHPERYIFLHKKKDRIIKWREQGCLFQINAGSIIGVFGKSVQRMAMYMLKNGFVQFVASDAHNINNRSYKVLEDAHGFLQDKLSGDDLNRLFVENPWKSIVGEDVSDIEALSEQNKTGGWMQVTNYFKRWIGD